MSLAGDEYLAHCQQYPEFYEDEGDPYDYPCEQCGAEPGEDCRAGCTATPGAQRFDEP